MKRRTSRSERPYLRLVAVVAAVGAAHCAQVESEFTPGSGGAALCDRACARIYDACHLSLGTASGALSRSQCVDQCRAGSLDGCNQATGLVNGSGDRKSTRLNSSH